VRDDSKGQQRLTAKTTVAQRPVQLIGYLACLAGFLICVVAFYPGYMSPDSIRQLTEGRAWSFTDWHPPLMAAVWGLTDRIIPGPFGMLLLQNGVFWIALGVFWRATYRRSFWLGLSLVGIGLLPTALAYLSTIWKDVGLGVSLLLVSALLYTARQTNSKRTLLISVPLLFYGYAIRHNAAPAVLPLALWSATIAGQVFPPLKRKAAGRRLLPLALGLVYFLLLTAGVLATTRILTGGRTTFMFQTVLLNDLTAISEERHEALFPDYILRNQNFSLENAAAYFYAYDSTRLIRNEGSGLRLTKDDGENAALRAKWLEVVSANKTMYLRHRWETFKWSLGLYEEHVCAPYLEASWPFGGYDVNNWRVHYYLKATFFKFRDTVLFRGFFWMLVCLVLFCVAVSQKLRDDFEIVFVLTLSGFLYGIAYFFVAPACGFRFFWWTALAALVSLCFAVWSIARRWQIRRAVVAES
jgi:hypothetical protein